MGEKTATQAYLEVAASVKPEVISITAPSGFVFKRYKPSTFAALFGLGELPASSAFEAAKEWQEQGVGKIEDDSDDDADSSTSEAKLKMAEMMIDIRDRVMAQSVDPKLVYGVAKESNELSVSSISPDDLQFLFLYEASGGNPSNMLGNFSEKPGQSPLASASRKKQRTPRK